MACGPLRRPRHAFACACVVALGLAWSDDADAADDERGRPWARGTWMLGGGPGLGFGADVTQLSLEIGGRYFVVNGLAVGLTLSDSILFYSSTLKSDFPGIQKRVPNNVFRIVPQLQYVFFRNRWFSPYVLGGVGPAFMNHGSGTHGYWRASPGAYIGLGNSGLFLDIGMQFDGMFPVSRCENAIVDGMSGYRPPGLCSFGWGPRIGLVGAFGGRGQSRRSKRAAPPPSNPLPREVEPPREPAPAPPVVEPTPVEPRPDPTRADPTPEPPPTIDDAPPSEPPPPGSLPSEPPPPTTSPTPGSESGPPTDPSAPERPIPPPF